MKKTRIITRKNLLGPAGVGGFTLIELLIVVAIIAILAAIAVPNFLEAQVRSKIAICKSDLRTLALGFEAYHVDHNAYPYDWNTPPLGGFSMSEWDTFAALTTPVAYITTVPLGIFQARIPMDRQYNKPGGLYEFWGEWGGPLHATWLATGTKWIIIGYGPNQT